MVFYFQTSELDYRDRVPVDKPKLRYFYKHRMWRCTSAYTMLAWGSTPQNAMAEWKYINAIEVRRWPIGK